MKYSIVLISLVTLFTTGRTLAQNNTSKIPDRVDPKPFGDNANHWYKGMDDKRMINPLPGKPQYAPTQLAEIGDNIILFQRPTGAGIKTTTSLLFLPMRRKTPYGAIGMNYIPLLIMEPVIPKLQRFLLFIKIHR